MPTTTTRTATRLSLLLGALAILAVFAVVPFSHQILHPGPLWVILPALAFLAEFLPVEVSRRGVRVTFTLPYVVGMAFVAGPFGAILTEVFATSVVGMLRGRRGAPSFRLPFLGMNASIAAIATSMGYLALEAVANAQGRVELQAMSFVAAYAAVNVCLVAYVDWCTSHHSFTDNVAGSLEVGVKSFLFYALLVTAVALLVSTGMDWMIPLTLVPVWAIRTGLRQKAELYDHYYETITALTLMLQRAHPYTHAHLERVSHTAEEVARRLGLSSSRARLVRQAAVLHDIGKIAVDEEVLDKPTKLVEEEMEHVRKHAEWGAQILAPVPQFQPLVPWIRHHHERPDGFGYPGKLKLEDIPLESRIIAVVDAFDAMTDSEDGNPVRTYRQPISEEEALAELERCAGTQFDPLVVKAFQEVIRGE